jgi:uncharacterized membrane protein
MSFTNRIQPAIFQGRKLLNIINSNQLVVRRASVIATLIGASIVHSQQSQCMENQSNVDDKVERKRIFRSLKAASES